MFLSYVLLIMRGCIYIQGREPGSYLETETWRRVDSQLEKRTSRHNTTIGAIRGTTANPNSKIVRRENCEGDGLDVNVNGSIAVCRHAHDGAFDQSSLSRTDRSTRCLLYTSRCV